MRKNLFAAWYCLAVLGLCLVAFYGMTLAYGWQYAKLSFSILGLLGLLPLFYYGCFRTELSDERDHSFMQRAVAFGAINGLGIVVLINIYFWAFYTYAVRLSSVPVDLLWIPPLSGLLVAMLTWSVMLLLFYHKGENADAEN